MLGELVEGERRADVGERVLERLPELIDEIVRADGAGLVPADLAGDEHERTGVDALAVRSDGRRRTTRANGSVHGYLQIGSGPARSVAKPCSVGLSG